MHPVLFKAGPFSVFSYGAMVALAFGVAMYLIHKRAPEFGIDRNMVLDMGIVILAFGVAGARLFYVAMNFQYFSENPIEILKIWKGGLAWYGGFLAAFSALFVYIKTKSLDFWLVLDLVAPYIALGQSIGRMGCFLNGCCFGKEVNQAHPFGVFFPGDTCARHPTQIYSALALIPVFLILRVMQDMKHFKGEIFLCYCLLYSSKRFFIEFVRADSPPLSSGLTLFQHISIVMFASALALFIYKKIRWKKGISE